MEFGAAPGLSFTKPLSATVNGKAVQQPSLGISANDDRTAKGKGCGRRATCPRVADPARLNATRMRASSTTPN
jgi:hypothetical protein